MNNFSTQMSSPALPPRQRQQSQVAPSHPRLHRQPHATASEGFGSQGMQGASVWNLNANEYPQWSDTRTGNGRTEITNTTAATTAAKQLWSTITSLYSTSPAPDVPSLDTSGVHSIHGMSQHTVQHTFQRLCNVPVQSYERVGLITTPLANSSPTLPPQRQQPLPAPFLSGEPLLVYFNGTSYEPLTMTEVSTTSKPADVNQPQYFNTGYRTLYNPSGTGGCIKNAIRVSTSSQQHPRQKLQTSTNAWASAAATSTARLSTFTSSSTQSSRATTSTDHTWQICGDTVSTPPDASLPPALSSEALPVSSNTRKNRFLLPQYSRTGQPSSVTAQPTAHAIVIGRPSMSRGTASIAQPSTERVYAPLHYIPDTNASSLSGTTYYFETVQGEDGLGNNSEPSYSLPLAISSRQPPQLEEYKIRSAEDQQPPQLYSRLIAHNAQMNLFSPSATAPGAMALSSSSLISGVASLTSLHSSAAGAVRSRELLRTPNADSSNYSDLSSWNQQPPATNTAQPSIHARNTTAPAAHQTSPQQPQSSSKPPPQERGIARRNRDRAVLFVGQLNYEATEADVSQVFSCYGKPLSVMVLKDKGKAAKKGGAGATAVHRKVGGSAFVTYATTLEADSAIMALHGRYSAKDDDLENADESKYLQVSYGQQTGLISKFGMMHAEKLHASKPENPIPFLSKGCNKEDL